MNKKRRLLGALLALTLVLAACSGSNETTTGSGAAPTTAVQSTGNGRTFILGAEADQTQTFVVTDASRASYVVDEEFFADALSKLGINPGTQVVVGTTPGVTGQIQLNFGQAELLEQAQFTVDMAGLRTDQERRDNWLRDNALQTARFPQAAFVATAVSGLPATYTEGQEVSFQLSGDLTIRDVTLPVTFDVTAVLDGNTLRGTAVLPLTMSSFGITPPDFVNTLTVADAFSIRVELVAQQQ